MRPVRRRSGAVDIHLPAEVLHFGIDRDGDKKEVPALMRANSRGVVGINQLAGDVLKSGGDQTPSHFVKKMTEPVPRVRFEYAVS